MAIKKEKKSSHKDIQIYHQNNERTDKIMFDGVVVDTLPGTLFKVSCVEGTPPVLCTLGGKLRLNKIRVLLGDQVKIEVSPYDTTNGRIVWRR